MTKHLYIDEYGSFVGKTSERLTVSQGGELKGYGRGALITKESPSFSSVVLLLGFTLKMQS